MSEMKKDAADVYAQAERLLESGNKGFFELYKEAADAGNLNAAYRMGYCYANGLGTNVDDQKAFKWYTRAAKRKHPQALYQIALFYASGKGCEHDLEKAMLYARKARKEGEEEASVLIDCLQKEIDTNPQYRTYLMTEHKAQDIKELRRVISQIVSREFRNHLYEENKVYLEDIVQPKSIYNENTLEITRIRAELGDDVAMLQIGRIYLEEDPEEVNPSADIAYSWLMKSAKCGNIDALKTLIAMFAGDLSNTTFIPQDHPFAWDLLRMLSWVHLDGLLAVKRWYEEGRFISRSNKVEMREACKGILSYRVVPKKYRRGWKDLYAKEVQKLRQVRPQTYIDLITCSLVLQGNEISDIYTREIKEYIDKALEEKIDILQDLAAIFIYVNRMDLLEYLAMSSLDCARIISRLYAGGSVALHYKCSLVPQTVFEVDPDFTSYFLFRYIYFEKESKFRELLDRMSTMLTELYYANNIESLQKIVKVIRTFNRILADNEIYDVDLDVSSLDLLKPHVLKLESWTEDLLHDFKIRILKSIMNGGNVSKLLQAANKRFVVAELCFPSVEELFNCLPMTSNRPHHYTYFEDLIQHNYDLSSADFSAQNRFDICFDQVLWQLTRKSRAIAGSMMRSRKASWELPEGMEIELDRTVEEYLDRCGGNVYGYWPSLHVIDTVHYSRTENGKQTRQTRSLNYMKCWELSAGTPLAEYIQILEENPPESDRFMQTLRLLYRYFAFRISWYEAVSSEKNPNSADALEKNLQFQKLHQKWKKLYLHFAEMVVHYVECH